MFFVLVSCSNTPLRDRKKRDNLLKGVTSVCNGFCMDHDEK